MQKTIRLTFTFAAVGLLALAATGCSSKARKARHLARADRYFASGLYDQAEVEYKNVLQMGALDPQAVARLGCIYFDQDRRTRAAPFLLKARELQPDNLEARLKLGTLYLVSGKPSEARAEAGFVLDRRPQDADAPLLLVEASTKPEEIAEARRRLRSLPPPAADGAPVLVALGTLDFQQRHLKEAEAAFLRAQTRDPRSSAAWVALGVLRWAQNDLPAADQALKKGAELSPPRSPGRLQYAQFKLQTGDTESGKRLLVEMSRTTPDYLPALLMLAQIAAAEKKFDDGLALVARVLARDSTNPDAMFLSGRLRLAKGEADKAAAEFEKLLSLYPRSPQATYQLGLARLAAGDTAKAADAFTQAISLAPDHPDAILMLAGLNLRRGDLSAAIVSLRRLVQRHPDIAQARLMLAEAYRGQGNLDDALAVYRQLEESNPRNPQAALLTGLMLVQQNKPEEARQAFSKALDLAPDYLPALEQLVDLDLRSKQYAAAQQRVQSRIAKNPTLAGLQLLLAKIFIVQQDTPQAEAALHKAIELQPDSPAGYFLLARLYLSLNQQETALANLAQVAAKNPKDVAALMLTGMIRDQQKNRPAARDAYEKVLAVNPQFGAALNNLAYLYSEHLDQPDRALELAQKARELLPNEPRTADTLGWILYKKRQFPRALRLLEESAGQLPAEAEVQCHLGMTHYMLGEEAPARVALERALQLSQEFRGVGEARQCLAVLEVDVPHAGAGARPALETMLTRRKDDPIALARLAALYERDGAVDKAIASWEAAAKAVPTNVNALLNLARLHAARGESAQALEQAKAARKLAPDDPDVAHALGRLASQAGDHGWAASLLQEAAAKQPDDPDVLFDLAEASYSVGRVADAENAMRRALSLPAAGGPAGVAFGRADQARAFLDMVALSADAAQAAAAAGKIEEVLKSAPTNVPALMALAAISEQRSDVRAAKQAYEKALGVYPDFTPAQKRLAIIGAANPGDDQRAYDLATQARAARPDDLEIAQALGILVYRRGDYARAGSLLQACARQQANDARLMFYLGMTRHRLHQRAEGKQALQRALDLGLTGALAAEARRTLAEK